MRRGWIVLLLLALVSLAGCGVTLSFVATPHPSATATTLSEAQADRRLSPLRSPLCRPVPCPIPTCPSLIPMRRCFPAGLHRGHRNYLSDGGTAVEALLLENEWMPRVSGHLLGRI